MDEEEPVVQSGDIEDDTNFHPSIFKTFIDNSGEYIAENLKQNLNKNSETFCELKLYSSDSRFIRVHRALFVAISPFLRSLVLELDPFESKELSVFLPEIRYVDLVHLVNLVYTGKICITKRTRGTLTKWLEILGISMVLSETSTKDFQENTNSNKIIYVNDELTRHRNEKLMCQLCRKSFKTESYMKSHLLTHTGEKPHKCNECGKQFRYKDSLKAHTRDHTGDKFRCQNKACDKEFNRLRDLKDHENIHQNETTTVAELECTTFACSICDAKFLRKKQLSNHMEIHRDMVEPCSICGKVLKNVACLRSHMRNHTTLKNFSCGTCGKAFKRNFDLTVHLRIHSGSKPYRCDICRKTFSLSSTLAKHKRFHDKVGEMKSKHPQDPAKDGPTQSDDNRLCDKEDAIRASRSSLMTNTLEMEFITHNTIADALIDLSQSANIVASVKDGGGIGMDQNIHRGRNQQ